MDRALETLLRWMYTALLATVLPFLCLRRWIKDRPYTKQASSKISGSRCFAARWPERFGVYQAPRMPVGTLWIHAVSVGELLAAIPLIQACQLRFPDRSILVTTTTPTASIQAQKILGPHVAHVYFPYDLPSVMQRFLKWARPDLCMILETELWPNCLNRCIALGVPVLLINACLSLRSLRGYQACAPLSRAMMRGLTQVCVQSEREAAHFLSLGLSPDRIVVSGNIKFDKPLPTDIVAQGGALRRAWGAQRCVWIAASTHPGEEELLLKVFAALRQSFPDLLLILVPRHPDRAEAILKMVYQSGFEAVLRTHSIEPGPETVVYLVDTLGELLTFYSAADLAFVGGSFVPIGGHNVLEPAAIGIPMIVGPHMHNTLDSMAVLQQTAALVQVQDESALMAAVATWLGDPVRRKEAGAEGKKVVAHHRGALEKSLACVEALLDTADKPR